MPDRRAHSQSQPGTGDLPPGVTGCVTRLIKILGFGGNCQEQDLAGASCFHRLLCWLIKILGVEQGRHDEDLVASSRFHRLLRGEAAVMAPSWRRKMQSNLMRRLLNAAFSLFVWWPTYRGSLNSFRTPVYEQQVSAVFQQERDSLVGSS